MKIDLDLFRRRIGTAYGTALARPTCTIWSRRIFRRPIDVDGSILVMVRRREILPLFEFRRRKNCSEKEIFRKIVILTNFLLIFVLRRLRLCPNQLRRRILKFVKTEKNFY